MTVENTIRFCKKMRLFSQERSMDINLEYYKIFYYVAGSQSITLAAEQLAISQPAVSQAVKHLEQRNLYRGQRHDVKVFPASVSGRIS